MKELTAKGAKFPRGIVTAPWGAVTAIELPGGLEIGLYEPRHPTALALGGSAPAKAARKKAAPKKAAAKKRSKKR